MRFNLAQKKLFQECIIAFLIVQPDSNSSSPLDVTQQAILCEKILLFEIPLKSDTGCSEVT